jgi:hypothetical protein
MKDVLQQLFPPGVKPVQRWRLSMFAFAVVVIVHILWACGWLSAFNMGAGFAYASDVKEATAQVSGIKVDLLEQALFDTRVRHCKAPHESKTFYAEKLQQLLIKYRKAAGNDYRIPECDEL